MSIDKLTRREFLKKGWGYTKAGLLVPLGCTLLSQCKKKDDPIIPPKTYAVSGNIKDITDDSNLSGIEVKIGTYSGVTNANGDYSVLDIPTGEYQTEITDGSETDYFTHKAGKLIVNDAKDIENKLININFKLIPSISNRNFINETIRYNTETRKWDSCPIFRIYTLEASTGNPVAVATIDIVKDIINNELYKFSPLFTSPVIEEYAEVPPAGFFNDVVKVYWSDLIPGKGVNLEQFNGNIITSARAGCKTDQIKDVWMQELTECIIGGGESNLESSILNDPLTTSLYTSQDLILGKIHTIRSAGNKDNGLANEHDVNPSDNVINL